MKKFRPSLFPWLAVFALTPLLLWLANWQFERYVVRNKVEQYLAAPAAAPQPWSEVGNAEEIRFQEVSAVGSFDSERQFLIDNMVHEGRNGFFVITPFRQTAGDWILVNRGWVAQDPGRLHLPEIPVSEAERKIRGKVGRLPVAGLVLDIPEPPPGWPSVRQFPDAASLGRALGAELSENIVLLDPIEADGFVREWRAGGLPASRHLGYAVQWLALAITLWVIAITLSFRKVNEDE